MNKPTKTLAEFLANTFYDDLSKEIIDQTKKLILDLLGVTIGAFNTPEAKIAHEVIKKLGGKNESTIIGFGEKTSCEHAAFVNSIMAHTLELDDTHLPSITHAGCVVIPTSLSMAEYYNSNGMEFLTAVILGYESMIRVALSVQTSHFERGFHTAGTCGVFGAATSAAKILNLDKGRMTYALGLAGTQSSGLLESIFASGDMGKRLNAGRASANGIISALLAEKNFTGPETILEGKYGFCRAMSNEYNLSKITEKLGDTYEISRVGLKPYACCRNYHSAIDAINKIKEKNKINPFQIKSIKVKIFEKAVKNRPHRFSPLSICDAQMSLPYSIAVALLEGRVTINEFTEQKIRDPKIHRIAKKVSVISDPEISSLYPKKWASEVSIVMDDGREFKCRIDIPKGEPENPMTKEEVIDKFVILAEPVIGNSKAQEVIEIIDKLEQIKNLNELTEMLSIKND